jgi:hypothetical protein
LAGNNITAGNTIRANTVVSNVAIINSITANTMTLTSAIQFANLTTTQINSISSPQTGMTAYNFTTGNIQVYNGTKWANVVLS